MQEVDLIDIENVALNITQTSYQVNCSSGWVDIDNDSQMIVEIELPNEDNWLSGLKSGIWLKGNRFIVGSISISLDEMNPSSAFQLQGTKSPQAEDFIDLLGELALITSGSLSSGNNFSLQFGEIEQIMSIGILLITIVTSFIILLKIGILSRIRDAIFPITASFFLFIAHIAYSPQKRRINEDQLLENELRVHIVDYLEQKGKQGAHLREIQREVGCGISSLLWHLQALDDFNLITNEKIGKYHIFYLTGIKSIQTTEMALALKSEVAKGLCRLLIKQKNPVSLSKISQEIEVHHSSVQHHVKKLSELGVILILKEKKRSQYIISPKQITWLKSHLEVA
jgi:predicted transcriptional regulator